MAQPNPDGQRAANTPDRFPPAIEYPALQGLPTSVRFVAATALLPLEAAVTTVSLLKHTDALLEELTLQLRALRPAVTAASDAYARGQFEPVRNALAGVQQSTNALAVVWAPFNAVREVALPAHLKQDAMATSPEHESVPVGPAINAAGPSRAPTTLEWLGGISSRVLEQAAALPGGAVLTRPLRRPDHASTDPREANASLVPDTKPAQYAEELSEDSLQDPSVRRIRLPGIKQAHWLVPGPLRRLLDQDAIEE